jgi:CAAX protease family protein
VLHALFDLRTLVLLPVALFGVHRIDGRQQPIIPRAPKPAPEVAAAGTTTEAPLEIP